MNYLVTGASGFVGSTLVPMMRAVGLDVTCASSRASRDFDLLKQNDIQRMLNEFVPDVVVHLAGLVGGIQANKDMPADFFYQNLLMSTMLLHESQRRGVKKFVTLIGGCSYPANAKSPIREDTLLTGYPQAESAPYSLAKAMSVVQAQAYRRQYGFNAVVLVPGNLYGPHDNFDPVTSHVIPALIRKTFAAKKERQSLVCWGSGAPVRDFVYIDDACNAILSAILHYDGSEIINISSGEPTSIGELVREITRQADFKGPVVWDHSKPDGQACKVFDVTRMRNLLGVECSMSLDDGLRKTIQWFLEQEQV